MAAPTSMTTRNISGTFVLNKTLTDYAEMDTIMSEQGAGWLTRKAVGAATLTLTVKHTTDAAGVERIDIDTKSKLGGSTDEYVFDWTMREYHDSLFGHVLAKTRRTRLEDVEQGWLAEGWTADAAEHGLIDTFGESDTKKSKTTWSAHEIWGFEVVGGERRYSRHVYFTGPKGTVTKCRMVYDYQSA